VARNVSPTQAAELLRAGWCYLDVRSVPEFDGGHPRGARNVPLMHLREGRMSANPDFLRVVEQAFRKDRPIVIGCRSLGRSAQAAGLLEASGYQEVVQVRGGFEGERDLLGRVLFPGWLALGLPVSDRAAPGCSYAELEARRQPIDSPG
jgi:rhodanese-related sulfurtransferase